jgi:membrane protein CcdC involved in cytochrome C biogenesis
LFRAKLRTLVCKPPVNCSVTHKPLDNKNNGTCYDCYQFVIKRLIEIAETRINTGFFKQLDLFKLIEIIIGIIFICFGYFVIDTDYYATLFYAMGFGLAFASGVQLLKICYYEMPKNKEKLQNINRENHINNVDERKIFLRMKAGSLVYQLMTFVYLFVAFVLALLHIEAWIIGIIFGLFLLQTFLGIILYKHFEKHF